MVHGDTDGINIGTGIGLAAVLLRGGIAAGAYAQGVALFGRVEMTGDAEVD